MKVKVKDIKKLIAEAMGKEQQLWVARIPSSGGNSGSSPMGYVRAASEDEARQLAIGKFGKKFTSNYGEVSPVDRRQAALAASMLKKELQQLEARTEAVRNMMSELSS